jgi:hypothetical protein
LNLLATVLWAWTCVHVCQAGDVEQVERFALSPAARISAPKIDGKVDKVEWYGATLLPRLINQSDGAVDGLRGRVYLGHDDATLYIAFQFDRPPIALIPAEADQVQILLDPGHHHKSPAVYVGNVAGPVSGKAWTYHARGTDWGWEGEAAISFTSLGRLTPKPGEVWGIDVVNQQQTPVVSQSAYSTTLNRQSSRDFNHIAFQGDAPTLRFREVGSFDNESGGGLTLELVNPGKTSADVAVNLELLRRKSGVEGGPATYLKGVVQATSAVGEDIVLPGSDLKDSIKDHLGRYAPDGGATSRIDKTLALGAGQRLPLRVAVTEPGDYLVRYDIRSAGRTLASGIQPFALSAPLSVVLQPFFLSPQVMAAHVDLRRVPQWQPGASLTCSIVRKLGEKPIITQTLAFDGKLQLLVQLATGALTPGGYEFVTELTGADGQRQALLSEGFTRPSDPKWFTDPAASKPRVPKPWTPIQAENKRFSFLMGDYELGSTPWPTQVRTRTVYDEQRVGILRAPMTLRGKVNGQDIAWTDGQWKVTEKRADTVQIAGRQRSGSLSVISDLTLEYDGMARVVLDLTPDPGVTTEVQELWLEVPLTEQGSRLFQTAPTVNGFKLKPMAGAVPGDRTIDSEFIFSIWLGDEDRGFRWFAENWKGWKLGKDAVGQAIQVIPSPQGATLRINFVKGDTLALTVPRQIIFGYQFTPPRTLDSRVFFEGFYHDKLDQEASVGVNVVETWYYKYQGWPEIYSEEERQQKVKDAQYAHSQGILLVPYSGWYLARDSDVAKAWGVEMLVDPVGNAGCGCDQNCWNTSITDAYPTLLRDRILDSDIDGYRMDAGFTVENCTSLVHRGYGSQCGWYDDEGKLQPSRAIFAARKAAQRAYRIFHGEGKENGACLHHVHQGNRYDAILGHQDAVVSAEGPDQHMRRLSEFPLDFFRAFCMGDAHGYRVCYLPKSAWAGYDTRFGIAATHNMLPRAVAITSRREVSNSRCAASAAGLCRAYQWIGVTDLDKTRMVGYWKHDGVIDTGDKNVVATYYVRKGERLLVALLNIDRQPAMRTVRVDFAKLGFGSKPMYARDANTFDPILVQNGGVELAFTAEGWRLIQFAPQPIDPWTPQRISDNLTPEFAAGTASLDAIKAAWYARTPEGVVSVQDSQTVITCDGATEISWQKVIPNAVKDRMYMVEAEARLDTIDDVHLGDGPTTGFFMLSVGEFYDHHERTFGSQTPPGHFEKIRLWYPKGENPIILRLNMRGKGKVTFRKFEVYEVSNPPPRPGFVP